MMTPQQTELSWLQLSGNYYNKLATGPSRDRESKAFTPKIHPKLPQLYNYLWCDQSFVFGRSVTLTIR